MKPVSAFAYLYNYYLVPEEYDTPEAFLDALKPRTTLLLTRLRENGCIAPYFIEEETELTHVRIDRERVHFVEAYLLSREDYNERLTALICAKCPGCLNYTPPAEGEAVDITGHEKEMTLDGLCLLRAEGEFPYALIDAADAFWSDLLEAEDSIRKPLFDGAYNEAADALRLIYARYFPAACEVVFAVNRVPGRRLMMFGALSPEARMVNRYLISRAPQCVTEYWTLYDHLPAGACRYQSIPGYDLETTPPTVEFTRRPNGRYHVFVHCPPAAVGINPAVESFRYLCSVIGEDVLYTYVSDLGVRATASFNAHHSLRDLRRILRAEMGLFGRKLVRQRFTSPTDMTMPAIEQGSRAHALTALSSAPTLTEELCGRSNHGRMAQLIDEWEIPICTLALNLPGDADARDRHYARICGELLADLQKDSLILLVDLVRSGTKLYIDFFATAAGETIEALRDLTPEFADMEPRLTVRSRTETRVMHLNYRLDTIKHIPVKLEQETEA